ncbi:MAG TPA: hypothetical protein VHA37_00120, partial [Candidatus Saccharimonadales bacterium]|nr:hypothetical protein [Candidatus Saccharimonadales bacterium]
MQIKQKMRQTRTMMSKAVIFSFIGILLGSLMMAAIQWTPSASADAGQGFLYTDSNFSAITGVVFSGDSPVTFHKTSNTSYDGGVSQHAGCHVSITVPSRGANSGTLDYSACTDGGDHSTSISIADAKTYTGAWVDHSHITVDGDTYVDNKIDDDLSYVSNSGGCGGSNNTIDGFTNGSHGGGNADPSSATITINEPVSATNHNCVATHYPIHLTDQNKFAFFFAWADAGTIQTSDGTAMTFSQDKAGDPYLDDGSGRSSDSKCLSQITADPSDTGNPTHGTLIIRNSSSDNPFPDGFSPQIDAISSLKSDGSGCYKSDPLPINIANTDKADQK